MAPEVINMPLSSKGEEFSNNKNVCAYARVSTDSEDQLNSFNAQKTEYKKKIKGNKDWDFVGLYADEGISGTSIKKRPEFLRMIDDARKGHIDLILTKSLSRFARNTVDTLTIVRELRELEVEVFFEKENISSLDTKVDFMLTIFSSIAQEESRNISENVKWGFRKRFQEGKVQINTKRFLGYDKDKNGNIIVNEEQAKTVMMIYDMYISGMSNKEIVEFLISNNIKNGRDEVFWVSSSITSILTNEKYIGDAILQKRVTVDYLTHKSVRNTGQAPKYYIENNHEPIISRKKYALVQELRKDRGRKRTNSTYSSKHPLSGRVYCGHCGKKLKRSHFNYGKKNHRVALSCKVGSKAKLQCINKPTDNDTLEKAVVKSIRQMNLHNPEMVTDVLDIVKESLDTSKAEIEIRELTEKRITLEKELREIMDTNVSDLKDNADFFREVYENKRVQLEEVNSLVESKNKDLLESHLHEERMNQIEKFLNGYTAINTNILNSIYKTIISTSQNDVIFVMSDLDLSSSEIKSKMIEIKQLKPIHKGFIKGAKKKFDIQYRVVKLGVKYESC